jgi:hypothetical protein
MESSEPKLKKYEFREDTDSMSPSLLIKLSYSDNSSTWIKLWPYNRCVLHTQNLDYEARIYNEVINPMLGDKGFVKLKKFEKGVSISNITNRLFTCVKWESREDKIEKWNTIFDYINESMEDICEGEYEGLDGWTTTENDGFQTDDRGEFMKVSYIETYGSTGVHLTEFISNFNDIHTYMYTLYTVLFDCVRYIYQLNNVGVSHLDLHYNNIMIEREDEGFGFVPKIFDYDRSTSKTIGGNPLYEDMDLSYVWYGSNQISKHISPDLIKFFCTLVRIDLPNRGGILDIEGLTMILFKKEYLYGHSNKLRKVREALENLILNSEECQPEIKVYTEYVDVFNTPENMVENFETYITLIRLEKHKVLSGTDRGPNKISRFVQGLDYQYQPIDLHGWELSYSDVPKFMRDFIEIWDEYKYTTIYGEESVGMEDIMWL